MKITDLAIRLRTSVMVLSALICLGGLFAYVALPKESAPSIEIPKIVITTLYAGASPDDIESLITQPIEKEVHGINGVEVVESTSSEGVSTVIVEFRPDVSMSEANQKVREQVDRAKVDMPAEVEDPLISEIDISEFPIMTVNLAANYSLARLKRVAESLRDAIEGVPAINEVDLVGGREREVQVDANLARLQAYELTFDDVIKTIRDENTNIPGGSVNVEHLDYLVRVDGKFKDPLAISDLVIKTLAGEPVYIRDVAEVRFGFKDPDSHARLRVMRRLEDGRLTEVPDRGYLSVISLNVKKRPGQNIIDAAAEVQKIIAAHPMPPGTEILVTGDESINVKNLVKDLENNIISGLIFVVAVLLFFLGVRTSLLVGVAIPLSMLVTFLTFYILGYTLNFIILFSLIIALGMLVDNAVVIVENIYRYLEAGDSPFEAARKGTGEVGMAVVASTATTVAVFVPMMFWPGLIGEFMSYLPLTLIVTLTCSLFVAIIINPVITGYFARVDGAAAPRLASRWPLRIMVLAGLLAAAVLGLAAPITLGVLAGGGALLVALHLLAMRHLARFFTHRLLPAVVAIYRRFLTWMLQRDYSARWAYARNTTALLSLTLAALLGVLGGLTFATAGQDAALVLLLPAGLFGAIGVVGVVVHTLEAVLLGGFGSVKAGLGLAAVIGGMLGVQHLAGTEIEEAIAQRMILLPATLAVLGLLGWIFLRRVERLILTDHRAMLLNGTLGALFSIIAQFVIAPTGVAFFPETDPNLVQVVVEGPVGMNLGASDRLAHETQRRIDTLLATDPERARNFKNVLVNVGGASAGGDMFGGGHAKPERSALTLNLVDFEERNESSAVTLLKLRDQLAGIAGADIQFKKDQQGPPTKPPINIEIAGPDFTQIVELSRRVRAQLEDASRSGRISGLVDIADNLSTGRPEMQVRIDRERAARFGLNTRLIASTIRTAINGTKASSFREGEDDYDITVRLREADRDQLDAVRGLRLVHEGAQIPVASFAELELGAGLGAITRKDRQRVVTVRANAKEGVNPAELLQAVQKELKDLAADVPLGYTLKYAGENEEQEKNFAFLTQALAIGGALILMILIAQFNSIAAPFIIMIAVALSLIGVLLGLLITRTPFSLFTFIGVISLAGIVVNNNIVLIDYTMQLRDRGYAKLDAIVEAGATRLRPVLLTALTTVLGLIPLTFGINIDFVGLFVAFEPDFQIGSPNTQFWGPMGTTIIFGLTFGTFLTLVIVPVMYSLLDSVGVRVAAAFRPLPAPNSGDLPDDKPIPRSPA